MPRPIMLGVVGDSAAGKTTLTRGLVRILGEERALHVSADNYHRYDRNQRAQLGLTPLAPECNYIDILEQHLQHLRARQGILMPVYNHRAGTFGAPVYMEPTEFVIVEGLLAFHTQAMRESYDVLVFLDTADDLRRRWKVQRDCTRRGYTTDQVLEELDRREPDAEQYIVPQQRHADIVIAFEQPPEPGDQEHLSARLTLRPGLVHPDFTPLITGEADGIALTESGPDICLFVPGTLPGERWEALQETIWERIHFASHLRTERLGEFTTGTELHRSQSLAVTQLLLLYQLVTARAAIAIGASGARAHRPGSAG